MATLVTLRPGVPQQRRRRLDARSMSALWLRAPARWKQCFRALICRDVVDFMRRRRLQGCGLFCRRPSPLLGDHASETY